MISATGSPKTDRSGVTLLELILVMSLLLVLLALVTPQLNRFSRARVLHAQAETVLASLHSGRDRSAADALDYRFEIDGRTCRLLRQDGAAFAQVQDTSCGTIELPDNITARMDGIDGQTAPEHVDFTPTGAATPARVTLADGDGRELYLVCRTTLEPFFLTDNEEDATP